MSTLQAIAFAFGIIETKEVEEKLLEVYEAKLKQTLLARGMFLTMPKVISIEEFLKSVEGIILDVRSPSEYSAGHITGALNFPLFSDGERAVVGTIYKQTGREQAVELGWTLVAKKIPFFITHIKKITQEKKVKRLFIYCWRGGMRSNSLAFFFESLGFEVLVLKGGHKSYRAFVESSWQRTCSLIILSGPTGCGKTKLLKRLQVEGEQILDIEEAAMHRGSAFGALGLEQHQINQETFTDRLFHQWNHLDFTRPIWVEDEGRCLGKVVVPEALFKKMKTSPLVLLARSSEARIEELMQEYGGFSLFEIKSCVDKIAKKLGGQLTKKIHQLLEENNYRQALRELLPYYDSTYAYTLTKRPSDNVVFYTLDELDSLSNLNFFKGITRRYDSQ